MLEIVRKIKSQDEFKNKQPQIVSLVLNLAKCHLEPFVFAQDWLCREVNYENLLYLYTKM